MGGGVCRGVVSGGTKCNFTITLFDRSVGVIAGHAPIYAHLPPSHSASVCVFVYQ